MKKILFIPLIFGVLYAETIKITSVKTYLGDKTESGGAVMYDIKKDDLSGNFDTCHVQSFENKITINCLRDGKFYVSEEIKGMITPEPALITNLTFYKFHRVDLKIGM